MSERSDPIFARIARRYDRINSVLSLGQEKKWRGSAIESLPTGRILDLGSGTGAALDQFGDRQMVGLDPVVEMLALSPISLRVAAVGEALPFEDSSFDGAFSAFVFRNLTSVPETLRELHRVIRPGGKVVVVDLARPTNPALASLHRAGTALLLPLTGAVMAGAPSEYFYLHRSLDSLLPPERLFEDGPFSVEAVWRMGMNGFVYGAVLTKES